MLLNEDKAYITMGGEDDDEGGGMVAEAKRCRLNGMSHRMHV